MVLSKLVLALLVGFTCGAAVVYFDIFQSFDPKYWGTYSDWIMIGITVVLVWVAAQLPEMFKSRAEAIQNMRFTRAVLFEYGTTRQDLVHLLRAFQQKQSNRYDKINIRMSNLYEATRADAAKFGSFSDLERIRQRALSCHEVAVAANECISIAHQTSGNQEKFQELVSILEGLCKEFEELLESAWERHVEPCRNVDS